MTHNLGAAEPSVRRAGRQTDGMVAGIGRSKRKFALRRAFLVQDAMTVGKFLFSDMDSTRQLPCCSALDTSPQVLDSDLDRDLHGD